MELVEQIRAKFANISMNNASKLEGFNEFPSSWVIKMNNLYAVGIEIDANVKINESFANVYYYTDYFTIGDQEKHLLVLASSDENLRNEFAGICAIFLESSENFSKSLEHPIDWWINWKKLIGNKSVERTIHGVLGELVILYFLKKEKIYNLESKNWTGPSGKTLDIITQNKSYEVKSSIIKYNNIVTISGQYQLNTDKKLSLMFVKFEDPGDVDLERNNVVSIDYLIKLLRELGMDHNDLNEKVSKLGFKKNSVDRNKKFKLLEVREYLVDENFPFININSLSDVRNRDRILQLTYKLDLSGLEYNDIGVNFF